MSRYVAWIVATLATLLLLYWGKPLWVPLLLAILLAQLLVPVVVRLERYLPRSLSVMLSLGLVVVVLVVVLGIVGEQVVSFQKDMPKLQERLVELVGSQQKFFARHFDLVGLKYADLLRQGVDKLVSASGQVAMAALSMTMTIFANSVLVTIFVFLMLYYRRHFRTHLTAIFSSRGGADAASIMDRILDVSQRYVSGLMVVVFLVGALDTLGFLLVRAPFPVLFGILGAIAVLIPYVGIIFVAPFCTILAWAFSGSWSVALGVLAIYTVIHFLEGNVLTPLFVGHQVNLNPLASILAVLIGGELWGPSGMLLFIPMVGMVELVLSMIPSAKPYADLLGVVPGEPQRYRRRWVVHTGGLRRLLKRAHSSSEQLLGMKDGTGR